MSEFLFPSRVRETLTFYIRERILIHNIVLTFLVICWIAILYMILMTILYTIATKHFNAATDHYRRSQFIEGDEESAKGRRYSKIARKLDMGKRKEV